MDTDKKQELFDQMNELLKNLNSSKPNDRSEDDRRIAIAITDLEKIIASFAYFILREV